MVTTRTGWHATPQSERSAPAASRGPARGLRPEGEDPTEQTPAPYDAADESEDESVDGFLAEMFENFGGDLDDDECTRVYWSSGLAIRRERVGGAWQYWTTDA